ncbi:MAG: GNAT family N-acetyltransferase [Alphaproteobacteria bacterium]|nr:GNAT family N-acetyltransferase [Alphaproteobacteria bacterium]
MPRQNELGQPIGVSLPEGWQSPPVPPRQATEGLRVRVEPIDPERHAADLHAANLLDETGAGWTYMAYGPFSTVDDYKAWMQSTCMKDDPMFWGYVDKTNGQAIGLGSYLRIKPVEACIEVGHIRLSPLLQRTPMATEVMHLMMKNVFDLGYRRYEWKCDALNGPSRRAAERLGFTYEGTFRQATHYKGRNRDTAWFAIVDKDWPAIEAAHTAWLDPSNFDEAGQQRQSLSAIMGRG